MKKLGFTFLFLTTALSPVFAGEKNLLSLDEVMRLTEVNSPQISADKFRELVAQKSVDVAKANYFPSLSFEAIDSTGFPGSSAATGITGLMDSPYRSGLAGGLVAKQVVWDFGRTYYDVEATKHETEIAKQNTRVTLYQIKQLALVTYFDCTFFHTQQDTWKLLAEESGVITKEAEHFVNTGQRSIVDRYLSKAETEEAQTAQAFYAERLKKSVERLATIMNVGIDHFSCPALPGQLSASLNPNTGFDSSPFLVRALIGKKVAEARLKQERSKFLPKIIAVASAGEMARARLVSKNQYAAGIGIEWPIVDLRSSAEIQRAKEAEYASRQEIESQKQILGEENAKYDEIIRSSQVRLQHLGNEYSLAIKAFKEAKKRYFSLEGTLIDLREAWRNLARVETEVNQTRTQLLQASGSKALLNGGAG